MKHARRQEERRKKGLPAEELDDAQIGQLDNAEENKQAENDQVRDFTEEEVEDMVLTKIFGSNDVLMETVTFLCPIKSQKLIHKIHTEVSNYGNQYKELYRDSEGLYRNRRNRLRQQLLAR
mgnify:CR=1 FL=1